MNESAVRENEREKIIAMLEADQKDCWRCCVVIISDMGKTCSLHTHTTATIALIRSMESS